MIYLSIEALNCNGWSSELELSPIKIYLKSFRARSLYISGALHVKLFYEKLPFIELIDMRQ